MRNYIHVMLCANLFAAQLVFVVGVERTENEVCMKQIIVYMYCMCLHAFISVSCTGCLFSHCCVAPLHVPGCVHVDVDGGCGPVCGTGCGFCQSPHALHCWLHHSKLWSVLHKCICTCHHITKYFATCYTGIPLVYMAVVVPIGLLVNTDDIGNHYGRYNTTSGELLAYVRCLAYMCSYIIE